MLRWPRPKIRHLTQPLLNAEPTPRHPPMCTQPHLKPKRTPRTLLLDFAPYVDPEALEGALEARDAPILALRRERAEVPVSRGIALSGVGVGMFAAGLGFASSALVYSFDMCPRNESISDDCTYLRSMVLGVASAGAAVATIGTVLLAFGLPRLRSALRRGRELGRQSREIERREPVLTLQPAPLSRSPGFPWSL